MQKQQADLLPVDSMYPCRKNEKSQTYLCADASVFSDYDNIINVFLILLKKVVAVKTIAFPEGYGFLNNTEIIDC